MSYQDQLRTTTQLRDRMSAGMHPPEAHCVHCDEVRDMIHDAELASTLCRVLAERDIKQIEDTKAVEQLERVKSALRECGFPLSCISDLGNFVKYEIKRLQRSSAEQKLDLVTERIMNAAAQCCIDLDVDQSKMKTVKSTHGGCVYRVIVGRDA